MSGRFKRPFARWLVIICLLFCTTAIVVGLLKTGKKASSPRRSIDINIDSNGTPHVLGITLAEKHLQDAAFTVIRSAGLKPVVRIDQTSGTFTNFVDTLKALTHAGLLSTNSRSGPSPYE